MDDDLRFVDVTEDGDDLHYTIKTPAAARPPRQTHEPISRAMWRAQMEVAGRTALQEAKLKAQVRLRLKSRDIIDDAGEYLEHRPAKSKLGAVATFETEEGLLDDLKQIVDDNRYWLRWL